ncbi:hypothetical protein AB0M50_43455 [Nonomuraea fuscirosea]|uniref:hypothetical protein n=1 Tax=Nonomuraea fuscirosea TaxID=1291556 RepID=UPI002DD97287|nr:hypothetical protein [Nonomuraea fuscirosea]WSA57379.1 hypothetical protein OIE67_23015 [Nonomuraea fuscirosea]
MPAARAYTMTIGYANGTGATATQGLACNGGAWATVAYPPTAGWGGSARRAAMTTVPEPRAARGTVVSP